MRVQSTIVELAAYAMLAVATVGCSHSTPQVPGSAKTITGGPGRFGYIAEDNGNVYVRDVAGKGIIATFAVNRGDAISVDPKEDRIELAGHPVAHNVLLDESHQYEISFDRAQ